MQLFERKLTVKQAEFYIKLGNATEGFKRAYPNVKKDETAKAAESRLLNTLLILKIILD